MRILATHHLALTTGRFELLRRFYVETLGLPVLGGFPEQDIVFVAAGSTAIEIIGEDGAPVVDPDDRAARHGWHHLAWEVEDVDVAFAELTARGAPTHSPPESFPASAPSMRIAFLRDPDGNLLELVQPLGSRFPPADRGGGADSASMRPS